ncbi:hypothetical protein P3G55_06580 [Leptospira sp. 96542]|nr:hypothetical protein [Leptospira sp. 96542]
MLDQRGARGSDVKGKFENWLYTGVSSVIMGGKRPSPMGKYYTPALYLFALIFLSCAPDKTSYFGEPSWKGLLADGTEVNFGDLPQRYIALNVYSPDCVPCWKEIPALNLIHAEISAKHPNKAIYMVVDPAQILVDAKPNLSFGETYALAKDRMAKEVKERGIKLPIVFMKPPFSVTGGLISGTPETLLLETKPLRLFYNFIGAITEETDQTKLPTDTKFQFFRHQFEMDSL